MYISKIVLNENSLFKEVFASGYSLHQAVWDLFADSPDRDRDFLYRLDVVGKMPLVYAVSERKPQDSKGIWSIEIKEYSPRIKAGIRLGFTVRVNPIRKKNGKRHDVVMDAKYKMRAKNSGQIERKLQQEIITEACSKWFEERAVNNGFKLIRNDIPIFRVDGYQQIQFCKNRGGETVKYSTVDITGMLEVLEESSFTDVLFNGIGPAKGFGCGLILVRKL